MHGRKYSLNRHLSANKHRDFINCKVVLQKCTKSFFPFGSFLDGCNCCVLIYNDKYITQGVFLNAKVLSVCQLDK